MQTDISSFLKNFVRSYIIVAFAIMVWLSYCIGNSVNVLVSISPSLCFTSDFAMVSYSFLRSLNVIFNDITRPWQKCRLGRSVLSFPYFVQSLSYFLFSSLLMIQISSYICFVSLKIKIHRSQKRRKRRPMVQRKLNRMEQRQSPKKQRPRKMKVPQKTTAQPSKVRNFEQTSCTILSIFFKECRWQTEFSVSLLV